MDVKRYKQRYTVCTSSRDTIKAFASDFLNACISVKNFLFDTLLWEGGGGGGWSRGGESAEIRTLKLYGLSVLTVNLSTLFICSL